MLILLNYHRKKLFISSTSFQLSFRPSKIVAVILLMLFLLIHLSNPVAAQLFVISASGEYNMGEFESIAVAKDRAVAHAVSSATTQASAYVESYSRTQNLQMPRDVVGLLSTAVLEVTDKQFEQQVSDTGGLRIKVTITCRVDTENIEALHNKFQDPNTLEEYRHSQEEKSRLQKEMEDIKAQLAVTQSDAEKRRLTEAVATNDQAFEAIHWFNQGFTQYKTGDINGAISSYSYALKLNPSNARAYNNRSAAYLQKNLFDEALSDCKKAIDLDPFYANAYINRGNSYKGKGLLAEAITDYNKAIALDPHNAGAYNNRGIAFQDKNLIDQAIADFSQAIAFGSVDAYCNRGSAYQQKGLLDQAIADYTHAISIAPRFAKVYYNRGIARFGQGLLDLAIVDFTQVITIDPYYGQAYNNRGAAYMFKGQYDQALGDFNRAISLDAGNATAYCNRGYVYKTKGLFEQAIADYNQTLSLDPHNSKAYFLKAFACDGARRYPEAIAAYRAFLQYAPPDATQYIQHARQRLIALKG